MRLARTVLLGAVAAALGIWWIGRAWDVESGRLVGFLLSSALLVAGCIAVAALAGIVLGVLRRRGRGGELFQRPRGNSHRTDGRRAARASER